MQTQLRHSSTTGAAATRRRAKFPRQLLTKTYTLCASRNCSCCLSKCTIDSRDTRRRKSLGLPEERNALFDARRHLAARTKNAMRDWQGQQNRLVKSRVVTTFLGSSQYFLHWVRK